MLRALAWGHPAFMLASITLAFLALRAGMSLRRGRRGGPRPGRDARSRHLRLAKPAVLAVAVGFVGGPVSMALLRGREPFGTAHAWIGLLTLALFASAGLLGRRLEQGRSPARDAHALLGLLAVLFAAAAAMAGLVLLP